MKKFLTLMLMSLLCTAAWAATVEIDLTAQGYTNQQEVTTVTQDGITLTFDKGTNSNTPKWFDNGSAVRLYGGGTLTITSANGDMSGIAFTITQGDQMTANVGTYVSPNWTGTASTVVFTQGGATGHVRIQKVSVTTGSGDPNFVAAPTFTPAAGTYYSPINVELKCGTAGASIYYTTDGTTPSASSTAYTEAIALSQTTTIKAIAINGANQSEVAEAAYVFEQATPVANIAEYNAVDDGTMVTFTNPVTTLARNSNNLYVMDETGYALIYGATGKSYKDGSTIPAGFIGKKTTYNGMPELAAPLSGFQDGIEGPAPVAEEIQCEDVSGDLWGHYVVIKGVTISPYYKTITDASGTASIHTGMGGYGNSTDTTKVYDCYAIIGAYRTATMTETTFQVLPYKLVAAGSEPTDGLTIAEFQALADGTDTEAFNAVTTLAQSGSRLFVKDDTGYMLVYGNVGKTYNRGDIIPAGFSGQKTTYDGEPELKSPKNFAASTESTTVTADEAKAADLKHENFGHYVVFKNATISGGKIYDADNNEVAFYCNMGANLPADETKTYDIYGIVGSHGTSSIVYQLLPTEFKPTDGSEIEIPEVADVEALYEQPKGTNARIMSDLVAIYQQGNRLFVKNNDTFTLVYGPLTEKFENGAIIRGAVVSWTEYQGAKQLVPVDSTFVMAEMGEPVQPVEMQLEEMGQDMVHTYFLVKNATLATTEINENTYMINDGTIDMKVFNQFGIEMPTDLEAQYDVKCFLTVYQQELQLYPVEITKVGGDTVKGDVTGDGQVDIADVNAVIDMMLGKAAQNAAADVTGDGQVDIADVNAIIDMMLGK